MTIGVNYIKKQTSVGLVDIKNVLFFRFNETYFHFHKHIHQLTQQLDLNQ